jgi:DNA-binding MltR family transcriptional regulator
MPDLHKAFDDFATALIGQRRRTHAGIVMAAGSVFDAQLESALRHTMRPLSKPLSKRVFDSFGPLSTFSNKIVMAHALGIVSAPICTRLEHLRKLRNAFAHFPDLLHFGSPEIAPLFHTLLGTTHPPPWGESEFIEAVRPIEAALQEYMLKARAPNEP